MTLVQLRHLIALAETGAFGLAAERVHLTQPALSRSIQALEADLGLALVDRVGRRAELTPAGQEVLAQARTLVADAQALHERSQAVARGALGRLRVGMGAGPAALLAQPLLQAAATTPLPWQVELARGATDLLLQRLRDRSLDALVVDLRSLVPAPDLVVDQVHELRGAFLVRPGHPLARRSGLRFADLAPYPLASIPLSDEVARLLMERYGPTAHPQQAVTLRSDDIGTLVAVAEYSDAVLLSVRATGPDLVELALNPPLAISARLGLVTLARRTPPPALARLRVLMGQRLVEPGPAEADSSAPLRGRPPAQPDQAGRSTGAKTAQARRR